MHVVTSLSKEKGAPGSSAIFELDTPAVFGDVSKGPTIFSFSFFALSEISFRCAT